MKQLLIPALLLSQLSSVFSQNIGINVNGAAPAASALLDIDAAALPANAKRGLLVPRVALTATNAQAPVIAPATSLLVYNTATAGAAPNNVIPGYYYWDGTFWTRLLNGVPGWTTLGNAGTNPAMNFLGTTDNQDLVVRTNNLERLRVMGATGRVGIGLVAPTTTLEASSGIGDAIFGHSNNVGGYLGRETNITLGVPLQTLQGAGVYASNPAAGYTSVYAQSLGPGANVAASIAYSDVWIAQYNYVQNASATFNPAGTYSQLNITNGALGGFQSAIRGYNNRGTTAGNPGYTQGVEGTSVAQFQDADAVVGTALSNSTLERAGGYFESNSYSGAPGFNYAWVGATIGGIGYKVGGAGVVAEMIPTPGHGRITLFCPESPEYWYQDHGTVELVDGHAHVDLDPILADIIVVDDEHPLRVFCTPVDMPWFNGITVTARSATGFDLVELNGGTHSGTIDYQVIATPRTNFGAGRFPQAPGPHGLKPEDEPEAAKAANRPDPDSIRRWPADWEVYGYDVEKATPIGGLVKAGPHRNMIKTAEGRFMDHHPAGRP